MTPRHFCVAGVALGDIHLDFTWQVWHNLTSTVVLRGRRGPYGIGLAVVSHAIFVTHHLSHSHTLFHTPSLIHPLSRLFRTPLCHTHHLSPHHLSHTTLSHTFFHHTIFHTQLCRRPSSATPSFTHHFATHHLSHTTLSHTQLCFTSRSSTTSFVFPYGQKLSCGVIRSFNFLFLRHPCIIVLRW